LYDLTRVKFGEMKNDFIVELSTKASTDRHSDVKRQSTVGALMKINCRGV
jgi:hypothetical protein